MKTHYFTFVLDAVPIDAKVEKLYGICQDGRLAVHCGTGHIHFQREAKSLEAALGSAVAVVRAAGMSVARVEMAPEIVATPPASEKVWDVHPSGRADYLSLEEAVAKAPSGAHIHLWRGVYRLAKPLT